LGEEMLILREGKIVQTGTPRKILEQPANIEVARLLGAFNLIPCEIRALDPGRNTSKVQMGEFELDGPYYPGRFKGDRVTMCIRPEQLMVSARLGKPGPNQIPAELKRSIEKAQWMRLEFEGGIIADMDRTQFERLRDNKDWLLEFPAAALRVL
jgi:molybdate transport system ATP-binding protein